MSLPYFARGKRVFDRKMPEGLIMLLYPDVVKQIGHLLKKPLSNLPEPNKASIISGYHFATGHIVDGNVGTHAWQKIIEIIFELVALVVPLGKADELFELYMVIMVPLAEAQQDLFHAGQQIEALKEADVEVRYKAHIEKYMALYEGLVKRTLAFPVYCLDVISDHKDLKKKDAGAYLNDDLSYKQKKIEAAASMGLQNDLSVLLTGVNKHLRNSIAHKRFEYTEHGSMTFRDVDRAGAEIYRQTMSIETFEYNITALELNFLAQGAALMLYPHQYADQITVRSGAPAKTKQLKVAIYHECTSAGYEPFSIDIIGSHLVCKVHRSSSLNNPSSVFGNLGGMKFWKDLPPLPIKDQVCNLALRLAPLAARLATADIEVCDHAEKRIAFVKVDLLGLAKALRDDQETAVETFFTEADFGPQHDEDYEHPNS